MPTTAQAAPVAATLNAKAIPPAVAQFDALPDCARVRLPVVLALKGCSRATAWRMVQDGRLPQPIRDGGITAWNVGQLRAALAA